jgi:hypothetical protein
MQEILSNEEASSEISDEFTFINDIVKKPGSVVNQVSKQR